MKNNDEMQQLLKEFSMLASVTSHAIKDPLRQAKIDCEAVKSSKKLEDAQKEVYKVEQNIDLTIKKIESLRQYSYLVLDKQEHQKTDCNIIFEEAVESLDGLTIPTQAKITKQGSLPIIDANYDNITSIFINLIENAIKFCEARPEIIISADQSDNSWIFCFSDNGIGIETYYRQIVFAMMQKLDPEDGKAGIGAGLTFCKRIIENHNGEIWIEDNNREGSDIFWSIPNLI